ncbi:MAG: hypothetical protein HQK50_10515, partial [Oligoflexia bacterium]|nr:hypothetical protein [Oligoflexia bacterium]
PKLLIIDTNRGRDTKEIPQELHNIWKESVVLNLQNPGNKSDYGGNIEVTANDVLYTGSNLSATMRNFFSSKGYADKMVVMKNDWLVAGHVDEQVSMVNLPNDRCGMAIVKADPLLAISIIKKQSMISSKQLPQRYQAGSTLDFVMLLQQFVRSSTKDLQKQNPRELSPLVVAQLESAKMIDANVALLKQKIMEKTPACKKIKVISLPVLFQCEDVHVLQGCVSVLPNSVNMSVLEQHLIVPDPLFAPFQKYTKKALQAAKQKVHLLDDNDCYHENLGDIHCGTNELRTL